MIVFFLEANLKSKFYIIMKNRFTLHIKYILVGRRAMITKLGHKIVRERISNATVSQRVLYVTCLGSK